MDNFELEIGYLDIIFKEIEIYVEPSEYVHGSQIAGGAYVENFKAFFKKTMKPMPDYWLTKHMDEIKEALEEAYIEGCYASAGN